MKKIWMTFILIGGLFSIAGAQTVQGTLTVGGGISYSSSKDENIYGGEVKSSTFSFRPSIGYFVVDNLVIGANIGLVSGKQEQGASELKQSEFQVGPFARYYKFTSNERFAFMAEAGLLFGSAKQTSTGGFEQKGSSTSFYLSPGFTYFLTDKWGLDLQLQGISFYSSDPNKDVDNDKESGVTIGAEFFNPTLGVRYFFK